MAVIDLDERGLETTRAELRDLGVEAFIARCDTASAESVTAAAAAVEKSLGPCSVLVNTAAVLRPGDPRMLSNLGLMLSEQGEQQEAVAALDVALISR